MAFNPDEYLKQPLQNSFNPDEFLSQKTTPKSTFNPDEFLSASTQRQSPLEFIKGLFTESDKAELKETGHIMPPTIERFGKSAAGSLLGLGTGTIQGSATLQDQLTKHILVPLMRFGGASPEETSQYAKGVSGGTDIAREGLTKFTTEAIKKAGLRITPEEAKSKAMQYADTLGAGASSVVSVAMHFVGLGSTILPMYFLNTYDEIFHEAKKAGKTETQAGLLATGAGLFEGVTEVWGASNIVKAAFGSGKRMLTKTALTALIESSEEGIQKLGINLTKKYGYNGVENIFKDVMTSMIVGGFWGGASGGVLSTVEYSQTKQAVKVANPQMTDVEITVATNQLYETVAKEADKKMKSDIEDKVSIQEGIQKPKQIIFPEKLEVPELVKTGTAVTVEDKELFLNQYPEMRVFDRTENPSLPESATNQNLIVDFLGNKRASYKVAETFRSRGDYEASQRIEQAAEGDVVKGLKNLATTKEESDAIQTFVDRMNLVDNLISEMPKGKPQEIEGLPQEKGTPIQRFVSDVKSKAGQFILSTLNIDTKTSMLGEENRKMIAEPLHQGEREAYFAKQAVLDKFSKIVEQNGINWRGMQFKEVDIDGIKMTRSELLEIYAYSQQEKGMQRLIKKGFQFKAYGEPLLLSKEKIQSLVNNLTTQEKNIYSEVRTYFDTIYGSIAAIYKIKTGEELPKVANYLPLFGDYDYSDMETEMDNSLVQPYMPSTTKPSMVKHRAEIANYPLTGGFLENFIRAVDMVENYKALGLVEKKVKGIIKDPKWKSAAIYNSDADTYRGIVEEVDSVFNKSNDAAKTLLEKTVRYTRHGSMLAVLGFNQIAVAQQPASLGLVAADCGMGSTMKTSGEFIKNPAKMIKFYTDNSNIESYRHSNYQEMLMELTSEAPFRKIHKVAFIGYEMVDFVVDTIGWTTKYSQVFNQTQNHEQAVSEANRLISKIQSMPGKSEISMSQKGGELSKMFTMYMRQTNKITNYIYSDVFMAYKQGKIGTGEMLRRVLTAWVIPALFIDWITSAGKTFKDWWRPILAVGTYPFQGIYFLREVANAMLSGYEYKGSPAVRWLTDLTKGMKMASGKGTFMEKLPKVFESQVANIGTLLKLPTVYPYRFGKTLTGLMLGKETNLKKLIYSPSVAEDKKKKETSKFKIKRLKKL